MASKPIILPETFSRMEIGSSGCFTSETVPLSTNRIIVRYIKVSACMSHWSSPSSIPQTPRFS